MPISARVTPKVLVYGTVAATRAFARKSDGEFLGHNITIETDGGPANVTAWARSEYVAEVGKRVALLASVSENSDGANLNFDRVAQPGDLDMLVSIVGVK